MSGIAQFLPDLPAEVRLALAYAPASSRPVLAGYFALDARLAQVVRQGREPILAQMRLAWWRERLGGLPNGYPRGEPLLAHLAALGSIPGLGALVDGWEALVVGTPGDQATAAAFAEGRAAAAEALCQALGCPGASVEAARALRNWSLIDLSLHLSDRTACEEVRTLATTQDWTPPLLPRPLRPLTVLHGLARRVVLGRSSAMRGAGPLLNAVRLGIMGR